MKNKYTYLLIFTILLYGSTCNRQGEDCHKYVNIINNSVNNIYAIYEDIYPDTLHFGINSPSIENKINTNDTNQTAISNRDCFEHLFFPDYFPSDTLMIYIFDANIIETEDWGEIVTEYMVLKRYDLSLQDLKDMNWTITYP